MPADLSQNLAWTPDASTHVDTLIQRLSPRDGPKISKSQAVRYALALAVGADTALVLGVPSWGSRVRAARAGAGLSQRELAEALGYSSKGTIGNVETGRWPPPPRLAAWVEGREAKHPVLAPVTAPRARRPRLGRDEQLLLR